MRRPALLQHSAVVFATVTATLVIGSLARNHCEREEAGVDGGFQDALREETHDEVFDTIGFEEIEKDAVEDAGYKKSSKISLRDIPWEFEARMSEKENLAGGRETFKDFGVRFLDAIKERWHLAGVQNVENDPRFAALKGTINSFQDGRSGIIGEHDRDFLRSNFCGTALDPFMIEALTLLLNATYELCGDPLRCQYPSAEKQRTWVQAILNANVENIPAQERGMLCGE